MGRNAPSTNEVAPRFADIAWPRCHGQKSLIILCTETATTSRHTLQHILVCFYCDGQKLLYVLYTENSYRHHIMAHTTAYSVGPTLLSVFIVMVRNQCLPLYR
jgi:hypothetical protein